jgi:hypothetical protein
LISPLAPETSCSDMHISRPARNRVLLALMMSMSTGLAASGAKAQSSPYRDIAVSWASVENIYDAGFRFLIALENRGDQPLPASGWELYFSMMRMLDTERVPPAIRLEHINGDFYRITPTAGFTELPPGGRLSLPLAGNAMVIKRSDAARGFYFVVNGERIPLGEVEVAWRAIPENADLTIWASALDLARPGRAPRRFPLARVPGEEPLQNGRGRERSEDAHRDHDAVRRIVPAAGALHLQLARGHRNRSARDPAADLRGGVSWPLNHPHPIPPPADPSTAARRGARGPAGRCRSTRRRRGFSGGAACGP